MPCRGPALRSWRSLLYQGIRTTESIAADDQQASSEDQSQPDETRSDEDIARDIELGYVHDELVLSFDPGTSADSINRTLASYDFAATKDVSDQDLDNGFVKVAPPWKTPSRLSKHRG